MIEALSHIRQMSPYALSKMNPPDGVELISLSQNESLRPPSPEVPHAVAAAAAGASLYPDAEWTDLRAELASTHGVASDDILCASGSLDLIGCIARVYAGAPAAVLAPVHSYPFFRTASQMVGARFDTAEEIEATVSVDHLLAAVRPDTRLVFVANPGNPTGTRVSKAELLSLRAGLPDTVLLVIDEAYGEFADHLGESCFDMVGSGGVVVLRTFSKAYGLAGMRVGWGVFPAAVAREMRKVMNPNSVSGVAQAAALAALKDRSYMLETCRLTDRLRETSAEALAAAGFQVVPSFTNFILIAFSDPTAAANADRFLRRHGVYLRSQTGASLPHALRMTIADAQKLDVAIDLLRRWKEEGAVS
ncbi:MAG: pyridoxal phosphate-dependent aminotransferase [Neomegalonema sp.]